MVQNSKIVVHGHETILVSPPKMKVHISKNPSLIKWFLIDLLFSRNVLKKNPFKLRWATTINFDPPHYKTVSLKKGNLTPVFMGYSCRKAFKTLEMSDFQIVGQKCFNLFSYNIIFIDKIADLGPSRCEIKIILSETWQRWNHVKSKTICFLFLSIIFLMWFSKSRILKYKKAIQSLYQRSTVFFNATKVPTFLGNTKVRIEPSKQQKWFSKQSSLNEFRSLWESARAILYIGKHLRRPPKA